MDPLNALGLASNVFSFVSFAAGLIQGTRTISASASGSSTDITNLGMVCEQLQNLCEGLDACTHYEILGAHLAAEDHATKVLVAVKALCIICKTDGDELLRIVTKLRTKDGSKGKWQSFRVALRMAWEKATIDDLEARLSRTQVTLTLHICTLAQ